MNPEQQQLIRASWKAVEPMSDEATVKLYERLFELDPNLRKLFGYADMERQRTMLAQTLGVVVRYVDRLDDILPEVEALGRRHASYGVEIEHYAIVGTALLWALEQTLGDAWTDETAFAWAAAYRRLSSVMIAAAQEAEIRAAIRTRPKRRQWRTASLPLGWQMGSTPT